MPISALDLSPSLCEGVFQGFGVQHLTSVGNRRHQVQLRRITDEFSRRCEKTLLQVKIPTIPAVLQLLHSTWRFCCSRKLTTAFVGAVGDGSILPGLGHHQPMIIGLLVVCYHSNHS